MADDDLPRLYRYSGYGGQMTESPAQDAALYRQHLERFAEANRAAGTDSLKDSLMMVPLGAGIATTLHGLRGLGRVLAGSSFMPYESGGIGLGWQGAKILGGAGLGAAANSVMDNPVQDRKNAFLNAVRASFALEREKQSGQ